MAATITIPFHQLPRVFLKYGSNVRAGVSPGLNRLAKKAGTIIATATKKAKAVNYGTFLENWRSTQTTLNGNPGVLVSNASGLKGATLEYGGRWPNKPPPIEAITVWAQKKFNLPYAEAKKVAWPIRAAIKRRGLRPRLIMSGPDTQAKFSKSMEQIFSAVVIKAAHKLGAP